MIKTNIMMRVNPEQSKQVQEICFANGRFWSMGGDKVAYTDSKGLLIGEGNLRCISEGIFTEEYFCNKYEEISAELFIRTKGTCVEKTPEQELKQGYKND